MEELSYKVDILGQTKRSENPEDREIWRKAIKRNAKLLIRIEDWTTTKLTPLDKPRTQRTQKTEEYGQKQSKGMLSF